MSLCYLVSDLGRKLHVLFVSVCLPDRRPNWSERSSLETHVKGAAIVRQPLTHPLAFQETVNVSIGQSALLTNAIRSLTIRCPAGGVPPPKVSWTKDGAPLLPADR